MSIKLTPGEEPGVPVEPPAIVAPAPPAAPASFSPEMQALMAEQIAMAVSQAMAAQRPAPVASVPATPVVRAEPGSPLEVSVRLEGQFADWLRDRAAAHGERPGPHAEAILRHFWAHHDGWRHSLGATPLAGPGHLASAG